MVTVVVNPMVIAIHAAIAVSRFPRSFLFKLERRMWDHRGRKATGTVPDAAVDHSPNTKHKQYPTTNGSNGATRLSYIDTLIANGTHFRVDRKDGSASFRPAGDSAADLDAFQSSVRNLRANEGDGYAIHIEHPVSDHGQGLVDLVLVTLDDA